MIRATKKKYQPMIGYSLTKDLRVMIDSSREIKYETFRRYIDREEIKALFGDVVKPPIIENGKAVSFHRGKYQDQSCVFIRWTALTYIHSDYKMYLVK